MIKKKAYKAKKGNWSIKEVHIGKNKKLDKLECFGLPKGSSCKGKGGVVLPPHPLRKTPPRDYVGMDSWEWKTEAGRDGGNRTWTKKKVRKGNWGKKKPAPFIMKPSAKKPVKKLKWYEKPIRINKGRK